MNNAKVHCFSNTFFLCKQKGRPRVRERSVSGTQLCEAICNQNNLVSSIHMTLFTGVSKYKVLWVKPWSLRIRGAVGHFYWNITPSYETHKPKSMPCPHFQRMYRIIRNIIWGGGYFVINNGQDITPTIQETEIVTLVLGSQSDKRWETAYTSYPVVNKNVCIISTIFNTVFHHVTTPAE
jgi:hypothetical protein